MFTDETLKNAKDLETTWRKRVTEIYEKKMGYKLPEYSTGSEIPLKYFYGPVDVENNAVEAPGAYPYTRGLRELSYQYTPWMIQIGHGYGSSEDTNKRTQFLLKEGVRGYRDEPVNLIFLDPPTHCGFDADHPLAKGMIGVGGAHISTLDDFHNLLGDYDLKFRVADNARFTSLPMLAMYSFYAQNRGYKLADLNGQSQNSLASRWISTSLPTVPPSTQYKLAVELIKFATQNIPRWNHTNLCGYVIGEMNATPAQELAMILAEALDLIKGGVKAGLNPDDFVSRFSSQMHIGLDFFEEIAKFRALRRLWAKTMKEQVGCKNPRSLQYRMHIHTGGSTLTQEQPLNNIARITTQVLATVLSGCESIHTASFDEAVSIPSEEAVRTSIRINQIILNETGVNRVSDPLGGSYYIEWLTNKVEEEASRELQKIESQGGYFKCVENGHLRSMLKSQSIKWRQQVDSKEQIIVGLNAFRVNETTKIPRTIQDIDKQEAEALERLRVWRNSRDNHQVKTALEKIKDAMAKYEGLEHAGVLMPTLIEAARSRCTLGEMMMAIADAGGGLLFCD